MNAEFKNKILEYSRDVKRLKEIFDHDKNEFIKSYKILQNELQLKNNEIYDFRHNIFIKDKQIQYKSRKEKEKERDLSNGKVNNNKVIALTKSVERPNKNGFVSYTPNKNNNNNNNKININYIPVHGGSQTKKHDISHKCIIDKINRDIEELEGKVGIYDYDKKIPPQSKQQKGKDVKNYPQTKNANQNPNKIQNKPKPEEIYSIQQIGEDVFHLERIIAELKINHKITLSKLNVRNNF